MEYHHHLKIEEKYLHLSGLPSQRRETWEVLQLSISTPMHHLLSILTATISILETIPFMNSCVVFFLFQF